MMDIAFVQDEIVAALETVTQLRQVFAYRPQSITPPAATVGLPAFGFNSTKGRGVDQASFNIYVHVDSVGNERQARTRLTPLIESVRDALDSAFEACVVNTCETVVMTIDSIDYITLHFEFEIWGGDELYEYTS